MLEEIASIQETLSAQIALPGDQTCFIDARLQTESSMEAAVGLHDSVPSGNREVDLANIAALQQIVDALKSLISQCGALGVTTTTVASKNLEFLRVLSAIQR